MLFKLGNVMKTRTYFRVRLVVIAITLELLVYFIREPFAVRVDKVALQSNATMVACNFVES